MEELKEDGVCIGYVLYAIIKADGTPARKSRKDHGGLKIYDTLSKAKNNCRADGDSVVRFTISLREQPLYIRKKKLL